MRRICLLVLFLFMCASAPLAHASFPGKNGRLAFSSPRGSDISHPAIFTMNPDGSDVARLTDNTGNREPKWSADGKEIAFTSTRFGFANPEIFRMNGDGTAETRLTEDPAEDSTPAWSPDSARIAFESNRRPAFPRSSEVFTMTRDGADPIGLTDNPSHDFEPDWSPDGARIAYVSFCCSQKYEIFSMRPDGSEKRNLTNHESFDLDPSWSPDGTKIAFRSSRGATVSPGGMLTYDLFVMNADGSEVTRLTTDPGNEFQPVWSPDGTRIAFVTDRDDPQAGDCDPCNTEVYTMAADGSGQTRATFDPAADSQPSWQPLTGPVRGDYKNAAQFCRAERDFWGEQEFRRHYGGGANAHGKCTSANTH